MTKLLTPTKRVLIMSFIWGLDTSLSYLLIRRNFYVWVSRDEIEE